MGQNAVGSAAEVGRSVPVQGPTSHNGSPGGAENTPISAAATQLWQKLYQSSVKSTGNAGLAIQQAAQNARDLVNSLGDGVGLDDLRQDIVANLQLLEKEFAVVCDESQGQMFRREINALKIQAVLTSSVLDRYCPVEKDS